MPKPKAGNLSRIVFEINPQYLEKLQKLKEDLGDPTMVATVRTAFKLLRFLAEEKKDGSKIFVRFPDGREKEIIIL